MKKKFSIKKIAFMALVALLTMLVAIGSLTYFYQDKLISLFVEELNRHLKAKVEVEKIEFSVWEKFPQAAITLNRPKIMSSTDSTMVLAQAEELYFTFSLRDLWHKQYEITELNMENGFVKLAVDEKGNPNYLVYQSADTVKSEALSFNLEKITLKNVAISYDNHQTKQFYDTHADNLVASLGITEQGMEIAAKGNVLVKAARIGKQTWLREKQVALNTFMLLDTEQQHFTIKPSELRIQKAVYALSGNVNYAKNPVLNLTLDAKNATLHGVLGLLPKQISGKLAEYQSTGDVYFKASVKGETSAKKNPLVQVSFGCKNGSFYHPDLKVKLQALNFTGSYTNGAKRNAQTSEVILSGLSGTLKGKPFKGDVVYRNFADPDVDLNIEADLDIAAAHALYPINGVQEAEGEAWIKLAFKGRVADLKSKAGNKVFKASGEVRLKNASFLVKDLALLLGKVNGRLQVNKNDFAVQDLSGKLGQSDFLVNGYFRNAVAWMLAGQKNLVLEADLKSRFLNFDELLSQQPAAANSKGSAAQTNTDYSLDFSPGLSFRVQSDVDRLLFRRLIARKVKGDIALQNQVLSTNNLQLLSLGGNISIKGSVDAHNSNLIKATTISKLSNIYIDSAMYVFEDFNQDFLQQKHLRGQLQAAIVSDIFFDKNLTPQQKLLEADITASIKNGQLIKFAPMEQLSRFVKKDELSNLRFSELTNHIQIYDNTIHIPEMDIATNLSTVPALSFSGTHTLEQVFDYKVKIPLPRLHKQKAVDARFGTVEQENIGTANLFLTIKGTPDNFKIAYDKERVKDKIKADLQKEKQELKDAFSGKEKPEKEPELNEQEYFDF